MRHHHTPQSASRAVRYLLQERIAKTWEDTRNSNRANAYEAALLVLEQVYGVRWRESHLDGFREVMPAVAEAMPELFAEYWEALC